MARAFLPGTLLTCLQFRMPIIGSLLHDTEWMKLDVCYDQWDPATKVSTGNFGQTALLCPKSTHWLNQTTMVAWWSESPHGQKYGYCWIRRHSTGRRLWTLRYHSLIIVRPSIVWKSPPLRESGMPTNLFRWPIKWFFWFNHSSLFLQRSLWVE